MKRTIVTFYEKKGFELTKLMRKKPPGIREAQIKAAAKQVYYEIQNGREIKDLNIPRRIFEIAKGIEYKEFLAEEKILASHKQIINELKMERFALAFIAASLIAALVIIVGGF